MAHKETHPIRNAAIAAVIAGIILSFLPVVQNLAKIVAKWVWSIVLVIVKYLGSKHLVYGWLIIILSALSFFLVIQIILSLISRRKEEDTENSTNQYIKDILFGSEWHWDYSYDGDIANIGGLCPACQSELVYHEFIPDRYNINERGKPEHTEFRCENCRAVRTKLDGRFNYAIDTVKREIRRKIRTEEYKI